MAVAAGLLSPALVSLVKRAQKVRQEMDYYSSSETINQNQGRQIDVMSVCRDASKWAWEVA